MIDTAARPTLTSCSQKWAQARQVPTANSVLVRGGGEGKGGRERIADRDVEMGQRHRWHASSASEIREARSVTGQPGRCVASYGAASRTSSPSATPADSRAGRPAPSESLHPHGFSVAVWPRSVRRRRLSTLPTLVMTRVEAGPFGVRGREPA